MFSCNNKRTQKGGSRKAVALDPSGCVLHFLKCLLNKKKKKSRATEKKYVFELLGYVQFGSTNCLWVCAAQWDASRVWFLLQRSKGYARLWMPVCGLHLYVIYFSTRKDNKEIPKGVPTDSGPILLALCASLVYSDYSISKCILP